MSSASIPSGSSAGASRPTSPLPATREDAERRHYLCGVAAPWWLRAAGQPRVTLPAFRQDVHTFIRLRCEMPILACTVWMFGFHRRLVRRCECDTDLPKPGLLPQTSQTAATSVTP